MEHYADLKKAIETYVFLSSNSGIPIVEGDERSKKDWIFDFRSLLLQPYWLNRYAEIFWDLYASEYPFQVCGMETAAISLVAAIVMKGVERGTPVNGIYIRKSRNRQGLMRQVEGNIGSEKIILVDDLINSGATFFKQVTVLKDMGGHVSDIFALVAYRERRVYDYLGPKVRTIFTLNDFGLPVKDSLDKAPLINSLETVWRFKSPNPLLNYVQEKSAPLLIGNHVYFGTDTGRLVALNTETGGVSWEYQTAAAIFSTPVVESHTIFFGSNDGNLYALNRSNGAIRWKQHMADRVGSDPVIAPQLNLIYVGIENELVGTAGGVTALSTDSGKQIWNVTLPGSTHSSPLHIEQERMVIAGDDIGNVCGYDEKSGSLRFHFSARSGILGGFAYDPKRRVIYFGSIDGICYGVFVPTGETVFAFKADFGIVSTPLIVDDTLYFTSLDKSIYAVDLKTGSGIWKFSTRGRIFASPTIAGGSLWVGSNDGRLYELDPVSGSLRSTQQFSERIVNEIIYDPKNAHFFVPTHANELYCMKRSASI